MSGTVKTEPASTDQSRKRARPADEAAAAYADASDRPRGSTVTQPMLDAPYVPATAFPPHTHGRSRQYAHNVPIPRAGPQCAVREAGQHEGGRPEASPRPPRRPPRRHGARNLLYVYTVHPALNGALSSRLAARGGRDVPRPARHRQLGTALRTGARDAGQCAPGYVPPAAGRARAVPAPSLTGLDSPAAVVFNLVPKYLEATIRQFGFMLRGLAVTDRLLQARNIPLVLLKVACHRPTCLAMPRLTAPRCPVLLPPLRVCVIAGRPHGDGAGVCKGERGVASRDRLFASSHRPAVAEVRANAYHTRVCLGKRHRLDAPNHRCSRGCTSCLTSFTR